MSSPLPPPPFRYAQQMPRFAEAEVVVSVGSDVFGREARLAPAAAPHWLAMRTAAAADGATLLLISGFRSIERQTEILRHKLSRGVALSEILRVNAYPGFSEHHTGRAIDLGSPSCEHLIEAFAATPEFRWLEHHAHTFGFTLTYPRNNRHGLAYEPWHWCWNARDDP